MMRIKSGIICVLSMSLAFAVACANSADPGDGDDDNGSGGSQQQTQCGDGTCDSSEVGSCTSDCGTGTGGNNGNNNTPVCGNGTCETGESSSSCFSDCGTGSGSGSGSGSSTSCPSDPTACVLCIFDPASCPSGLDQNACTNCIISGGGGFGDILCEGGAADGTCNAAAGEDATTCASDCP